jgi:murein DD-endopeptidase
MRKGSITVARGDRITVGTVLGLVGLSGKTEFPHLHFQVHKDKDIVDPFVGLTRSKPCGVSRQPLWKPGTLSHLPYQEPVVIGVGFGTAPPPKGAGVAEGTGESVLSRNSGKFLLWAEIYRVKASDTLVVTIIGPDGKKFRDVKVPIKRDLPYARRIATFRTQGNPWRAGVYRGFVSIDRGGKRKSSVTTTVSLR